MPEEKRYRSRFRPRDPRGRPPTVVDRDIQIFQLLDRYRILRSGSIIAFFPEGNRTDILNRLADLYDFGYIKRLDRDPRFHVSLNSQAVYEIDDLATQELKRLGLFTGVPYGAFSTISDVPHSQMICDIVLSIDLGCQWSGLHFIPWYDILQKAPCKVQPNPMCIKLGKHRLMPDAIFGIEYERGRRYFALEADRETESLHSTDNRKHTIHKKLLMYRELLKDTSSHFGFNAPLMPIFVTIGSQRRDNMIDELRRMTKIQCNHEYRERFTCSCKPAGNKSILFASMQNGWKTPTADSHMISMPYLRAVYPPFKINE